MAKTENIPEVIPFRPNPEDRQMISELLQLLKPRKMSMLIRKALECLLEKERAKR
jgi:hypothetical protein